MPKYRVIAPCFINNGFRNEGEIVDYDGPAGAALVPVDDEGNETKADTSAKKWTPKAKRESVEGSV
jgi:hypothetical protein